MFAADFKRQARPTTRWGPHQWIAAPDLDQEREVGRAEARTWWAS